MYSAQTKLFNKLNLYIFNSYLLQTNRYKAQTVGEIMDQ